MLRLLTRSMLSSLLVLFLFAAVAWAQDETTSDGPQPSCIMQELRKDFGEIFEQDKYTHEFKVKNAGDADLKIISVRPG